MVNKQVALELLNKMEIIDTDSDGEVMVHIYVENSPVNRLCLTALGKTDAEIDNAVYDHIGDGDVIDLNHFAWDYAEWFNGDTFLDYKPEEEN